MGHYAVTMTTTVDVPKEMLERVMKTTRARTEEEAVLAALAAFNERSSLEFAVSRLGTFEDFMTPGELKAQREQG